MKSKCDLKIIYFAFVVDFLSVLIIKYAKYINSNTYIIKTSEMIIKSKGYDIMKYLGFMLFQSFYLLTLSYIVVIIFLYKRNLNIYLKRNTVLIIILFSFDTVLRLFNLKRIVLYSNAFRFVIICLFTNLVVYIKYKKII